MKPEFLSEPKVEAATHMAYTEEALKSALILKVGALILTHTREGLKIKPARCVGISVSNRAAEEDIFDLDVRAARSIADKINACCDWIEAEDAKERGDARPL